MAMGMGMMQRHPEMKGNLNVDPQIDRGGLARVPWVTGDNNRTRRSDIAILLTPWEGEDWRSTRCVEGLEEVHALIWHVEESMCLWNTLEPRTECLRSHPRPQR